MRRIGFTVPELLIVLSIISLVAVFTIPKVMHQQTEARRKAVFIESIGALDQVLRNGKLKGDITVPNPAVADYVINRINTAKICTSAEIQGCWFGGPGGFPYAGPGFIMHNGACIIGLDVGVGGYMGYPDIEDIGIDWNGTEGPNLIGEDILVVWFNMGNTTETEIVAGTTLRYVPGYTQVEPLEADLNLWNRIFTEQ